MKRKQRFFVEFDMTEELFEVATSQNDRRTQLIADLFDILSIRVIAILILNIVILGALVGYWVAQVL